MSTGHSSAEIMTGADVFCTDGEKVGTVAEVYPDYIVVEKDFFERGFFLPSDYYIPMSAVASVHVGEIFLTVTQEEVASSGWATEPADP